MNHGYLPFKFLFALRRDLADGKGGQGRLLLEVIGRKQVMSQRHPITLLRLHLRSPIFVHGPFSDTLDSHCAGHCVDFKREVLLGWLCVLHHKFGHKVVTRGCLASRLTRKLLLCYLKLCLLGVLG